MRRVGFWIGINIALIGMMAGLGFWLYTSMQANQVSHFIEEKQELILATERGNIREGNIDTTHVVATLPTDGSGQVLTAVENRMLTYIQKRLGHKKPAGKINKLFFISSKEVGTNFKNVKAREIQAENYRIENLQIKKQETLTAGRILLTQDNQLFTLETLLSDMNRAKEIFSIRLAEAIRAKGLAEEVAKEQVQGFADLDIHSLNFTYSDSRLHLELPDGTFSMDHFEVPISDLYPIINSDYLVEGDKAAYDEYQAEQAKAQARDKKSLRQVALTFDDGPNPKTTPVVLDLLKKYNAKATFFVIGKAVAGNEAILRRMVSEGHEIANHTWNHPDLVTISSEQVQREIQDTQEAIKAAAGVVPTMVRPPYGSLNQSVVNQIGLPSIYWTVDSLDWKSRNPQAILGEIKAHTSAGSIILMHDIHQPTVDSLESVLQFLTGEGYQMVTVTDLLGSPLNPQYIYYSQESAGPAH